jgi:hypothetical protein
MAEAFGKAELMLGSSFSIRVLVRDVKVTVYPISNDQEQSPWICDVCDGSPSIGRRFAALSDIDVCEKCATSDIQTVDDNMSRVESEIDFLQKLREKLSNCSRLPLDVKATATGPALEFVGNWSKFVGCGTNGGKVTKMCLREDMSFERVVEVQPGASKSRGFDAPPAQILNGVWELDGSTINCTGNNDVEFCLDTRDEFRGRYGFRRV